MAAPRKQPEARKSERLSVALSADELDRICRTAMAMRMDVSAFVRLMCIPDSVTAFSFGSELTTKSIN